MHVHIMRSQLPSAAIQRSPARCPTPRPQGSHNGRTPPRHIAYAAHSTTRSSAPFLSQLRARLSQLGEAIKPQ